MKQVVLMILSLVMLLSTLASAEDKTVKLGDYTVNFDLGLPKDYAYNVDVKDSKQTETLSGDQLTTYEVWMTNETTLNTLILGLVRIEKTQQAVPPNGREMQMMLNTILNQSQGAKSNIEIATRNVDGTEGAVTSYDWDFGDGIVKKTYLLGYAPNVDSPRLVLWALSTFPWDYTLRFLKTIHTEKQK